MIRRLWHFWGLLTAKVESEQERDNRLTWESRPHVGPWQSSMGADDPDRWEQR